MNLARCSLLLFISHIARADHTLDLHFVRDLIVDYQLLMPTVIFNEDIPDICMSDTKLHCVSNDNADNKAMIEHVAHLHNKSRQDALIVIGGGEVQGQLLARLARLAPFVFTSNCPVFMPLEYSFEIPLRLDSNVIFYEEEPDGVKMTDKFAVKGGAPITLDLGMWDTLSGFRYERSKNRWDRRRDLNGELMVYSLFNPRPTTLIRDEQGNIVGSRGFYSDALQGITESLKMATETVLLPPGRWKRFDNGTWTGGVGWLQKEEGDVCLSVAISLDRDEFLQLGRGIRKCNGDRLLRGSLYAVPSMQYAVFNFTQ